VLTLTKSEMWEVPKENVEAVKKAAAEHGAAATQLGGDWNQVFHSAPTDMKMSDKQKTMMDSAKESKSTMGVGMMAAPMAPMVEYALTKDAGPNIGGPASSKEAARILIKLSDKTELTIVRTNVDIKSDMCIWRGAVEGTGAPATIMWWPGGKMAGNLQHEGKIYSIRHMGGEMHAVVEMAEDRMPQEHAPMPERMRANDPNLRDDPLVNQGDASIMKPKGNRKGGQRQQKGKTKLAAATTKAKATDAKAKTATADAGPPKQKDIVIDVLVAYTKKAAANYIDVKRELVDLSIEEANESFRQSNLPHVKLRLVHAYQTDYVEEGAHFDHVWRFADKGDGYMEEVHPLREKYRADVGILIVDDPKGCGLATRVYADADEAFAVVHHECAASSYTLAHEIGHLIGARHDLSLDKNMTPFPYGHGFVNGTKWRDIMSYKDSCGGCPRLPVWSGPKVVVKGEVAGSAELDNARVISEQAARVAAFR
jgi:Metallo-peptidase family M12